MTYYVCTIRPSYCSRLVYTRVIPLKDFSWDCLPPDLCTLWKVENVKRGSEAIAAIIEKAAGLRTSARVYPCNVARRENDHA